MVIVPPARKLARGRPGGNNNGNAAHRPPPPSQDASSSPTSPLQLFISPMMRSVFSNNGAGYFKFPNSISDDVRKRLRFKNGEWAAWTRRNVKGANKERMRINQWDLPERIMMEE